VRLNNKSFVSAHAVKTAQAVKTAVAVAAAAAGAVGAGGGGGGETQLGVLRCMDCGHEVRGQSEAAAHAQSSGHQRFEQV